MKVLALSWLVLRVLIPAATAAGGGSSSASPAASPPALRFDLKPRQIPGEFAKARGALEAAVKGILAIPERRRDFENTALALESAWSEYSDHVNALWLLRQASADKKVRDAVQRVEEQARAFEAGVWNDRGLYEALSALAQGQPGLAGEEALLLKTLKRGFEEGGAHLSRGKKAELRRIRERLALIAVRFESNLAEDEGRLEVPVEELKGLPPEVLGEFPRTPEGKVVVLARDADYPAVMSFAESPELRRRLHRVYHNRAARKNLPLVSEALGLRHRAAKLLGQESHAHLTLTNRMARTPEAALSFLRDLWKRLRPQGEKELGHLLSLKRRDDPRAERLEPWDWYYYEEKAHSAGLGLDREELRRYFPLEQVISGSLRVFERLFGLRLQEVPVEGAWHPEVRLVEVSDAATGRGLGRIYLDLMARAGKAEVAGTLRLLGGRLLPDGSYQQPAAAVLAEFARPARGQEALLDFFDEVETLFHEMGHALHEVLTRARHASLSGFSVAWDFIETPSQALAGLIWEPEVLSEISGHVREPSRKLPEDLLRRMKAAQGAGKGLHWLRLVALSMADLLLHVHAPANPSALFNEVLEMIGLVPVARETNFLASFGYISEGYDAGYYAYPWSAPYAAEIAESLRREGLFGGVGLRLRREILETGGSRPEAESLRRFLGREPTLDPFLAGFENGNPREVESVPSSPRSAYDAARAYVDALFDDTTSNRRRYIARLHTLSVGHPQEEVQALILTGLMRFISRRDAFSDRWYALEIFSRMVRECRHAFLQGQAASFLLERASAAGEHRLKFIEPAAALATATRHRAIVRMVLAFLEGEAKFNTNDAPYQARVAELIALLKGPKA